MLNDHKYNYWSHLVFIHASIIFCNEPMKSLTMGSSLESVLLSIHLPMNHFPSILKVTRRHNNMVAEFVDLAMKAMHWTREQLVSFHNRIWYEDKMLFTEAGTETHSGIDCYPSAGEEVLWWVHRKKYGKLKDTPQQWQCSERFVTWRLLHWTLFFSRPHYNITLFKTTNFDAHDVS